VKTFFAIVLALGLLTASAFAQPVITGVQNAASNALVPLPNANIALGSYFSIYGTGFGPASSTCSTLNGCLWSPYPLPTSIGGASASIVVNGTTTAAYIEFAANFGSYSQINAVLPSTTPTGTGTVTVSYGGSTSATFPITVVAASFGTFSVNEAGTGPGIITDVNFNVLTPFHTAKPGDYVILWGTGLGAAPDISTEGTSAPPSPPVNFCPAVATCPTVWVAGQQAVIYYAGRSTYTAEDQVIFQVPTGVQGCYVQVAIQTGSVISNFTSMTVDPNGATCQDSDGVNYNDIASLISSKGQASVGTVSMLSNYLTLSIPALGGTLEWDNDTVSGEIGTFSTGVIDLFQGFALAPSVNNCSVSPFLKYPPPTDPGLSYVTYLDTGSQLTLQGPTASAPVPKNTNGKGYSGLVGGETIDELIGTCTASNDCIPFFLNATGWGTAAWTYAIVPGTFTITSPGGSQVGAMSAAVDVTSAAASFKWTNPPTGPISLSSPLTINWTGGDPNGFVDITAISSTLQSGTVPAATTPGILVECIAPASAGTFTVPTYVLQSLPSTASSTALVPPGELLVGPASSVCGGSAASSATCPSTITPPSGLDEVYIFYHYIAGSNVTWQ
jgi:uncharacterized protein (TIGR03437 family)